MKSKLDTIAFAICETKGYEYVDFVGGGTFKETFHITMNGCSYALKVFRSGNSSKRTERELEAMVRCDHPNIGKLKFVSSFLHNNQEYLYTVEEYLAGGTLTKRLENGCLSIDEVLPIGKGIIQAVSHIASQNLVHRDIKPDNILFREDGTTPVIVDFGLVRNLTDESLTQTWLVQGPGSPYFASPEQLNNQKELIDWRTDQFAVGVLLSICCFGIHPYSNTGDNPSDVVVRVAQREPLNIDFIANAKEIGFNSLIKMVSQWPIGRFRTPRELLISWPL